jgi:hypothetical protein
MQDTRTFKRDERIIVEFNTILLIKPDGSNVIETRRKILENLEKAFYEGTYSRKSVIGTKCKVLFKKTMSNFDVYKEKEL